MFNHVAIVELKDLHYVLALPVLNNGVPIVEEYDTLQESIERAQEFEPCLEKRKKLCMNAIRSTRIS